MNDYGTSVLLGIVEGLTEFLPVSSTAHLLVTENALGLNKDNWEAFTVVIQLGAVLSVVAVYWRKFWDVLVGLPSDPKARQFAINVIIAFLPSAVLGAVFIKYINGFLLDPSRAIPVISTSGFRSTTAPAPLASSSSRMSLRIVASWLLKSGGVVSSGAHAPT